MNGFKATNGDLVSLDFEIVPLPEVSCVKSVVGALQKFDYNIEISISEAVGDITVRENDDAVPDSAVMQHRLVTKIASSVDFKANNVAYGEYYPANPALRRDHERAMMICDIVDEDKLFPYRPSERVRQDVTTLMMLAWHQRENEEPIAVMTRWRCLRIQVRHSHTVVLNRMRNSADKVAEAMLSTIRQAASTVL
ncbi:unnamed protein product [Phytophthora lilii]|uniref:Unnamed protein product n=1 Tax=Phytophthora lilii TaxID=2077276 RepID=A0A9W6UBR3_9STRA|nr:unnamed protein product [Phytophthora lilii]